MKESLNTRLIEVLKTDKVKFNRYIKFCLSIDVEFSADLSSADLSYADLSYADLSYADLSSADLSYADIRYADLSYADLRSAELRSADLRFAELRSADLRSADLRSADLRFADLDFATFPLFCGSLKMKTDIKIRTQVGFHFASLIANCEDATEQEKEIYNSILEYVNNFHRQDVERLKKI